MSTPKSIKNLTYYDLRKPPKCKEVFFYHLFPPQVSDLLIFELLSLGLRDLDERALQNGQKIYELRQIQKLPSISSEHAQNLVKQIEALTWYNMLLAFHLDARTNLEHEQWQNIQRQFGVAA